MAYGNPIPFHSLVEASKDFDSRKSDYNSEHWRPEFTGECRLTFIGQNLGLPVAPYGLTKNAWEQFSAKMGPVAYGKGSGRSLPTDALIAWSNTFPEQTAALLNSHLNAYEGGLLVRTYEDRARAVLSDKYAVIDNSHILEVAEKAIALVEERNPNLSIITTDAHAYVTPDNMHVKITLANVRTPGGDFGIGCYLGNSEIGRGRVRAHSFIQRHSCQNSTIFTDDESNLDAVHRGVGQILVDRMVIAIFHAFKLGNEHLAAFLSAQEIEIPDFEKELTRFATKEGWSMELTGRAFRGSEGQDTLFGFVNALTYTAQALDMDDRIKLEMKAGAILANPSSIFGSRVRPVVVAEL